MAETLLRESPAGTAEWALLQTMKVGDIREGLLFPALEVGVVWVCVATGTGYWEFDGSFFGQPLCKAVIRADDTALSLEVRGL